MVAWIAEMAVGSEVANLAAHPARFTHCTSE
jgi:hypothetical protein